MGRLLAAAFAAMTAIFAKVGIEHIGSDFATLHPHGNHPDRAWRDHRSPPANTSHCADIAPRTWLFLTLSGLATGASWLCYFRALKLGNASQVAPVDKLSVVLVAVFGAVFLGERLSAINWLGVVLIAVGRRAGRLSDLSGRIGAFRGEARHAMSKRCATSGSMLRFLSRVIPVGRARCGQSGFSAIRPFRRELLGSFCAEPALGRRSRGRKHPG